MIRVEQQRTLRVSRVVLCQILCSISILFPQYKLKIENWQTYDNSYNYLLNMTFWL